MEYSYVIRNFEMERDNKFNEMEYYEMECVCVIYLFIFLCQNRYFGEQIINLVYIFYEFNLWVICLRILFIKILWIE